MKFFLFFLLICSSQKVLALDSLSYSGRLVNTDGSPVTGEVDLQFKLAYTDPTPPLIAICTKQIDDVSLTNGVFHIKLNFDPTTDCGGQTMTQILAGVPANETIALQVVDVTVPATPKPYPYQAIHSIPSAIMANMAKTLHSLGATTAGQALIWDGSKWAPGTVSGATGGTVTRIDTGTGLTGGPIETSGTISIVAGGVTTTLIADLAVTDAKIASGISRTKLANGIGNHVLVNDGTGIISSVASISIAQGGTGASTAAGARTNLGLKGGAVADIGYAAGNVMPGDAIGTPCLPGEVLTFQAGPVYFACVADQNTDTSGNDKLPLAGGLMSGAIDMGGHTVTNIGVPMLNTDAATKSYVDSQVSSSSFWTLSGIDIYRSSGNVGIGTTTPTDLLSVSGGNILASGTFGSGSTLSTTGAGTRMIWYPRKAAFRVGAVTDTNFDDINIGNNSIALGNNPKANGPSSVSIGDNTLASGQYSVSLGAYSKATGLLSVAVGNSTTASGTESTAFGTYTTASGDASTSFGSRTTAPSYLHTVFGQHNALGTVGSSSTWVATDPLFQIGNGSSSASKSSALTVLKNGNIGLGSLAPTAVLHLKAGTSSANTAPLKFSAGVNLTTPEAGAVEFDGTNLYYTDNTNTRRALATSSGGNFTDVSSISGSGALPITAGGTNQNLTLSGSGTGSVISNSPTIINNTTSSTSPNTGAMTVSGGMGVQENIYAGGNVSTNGIFLAPIGSAAAPSYSFIPDTDTGVFSPGADIWAVSAAGSEKIRVDSVGLGVGTSAPNYVLDVHKASAGGDTLAQIKNSATQVAGASATLGLNTGLGTPDVLLKGIATDATAGGRKSAFTIHTYNQLGDGVAERLRVDDLGRVGIGTSSPARTVHIAGSQRIERNGTPHLEMIHTGAPVDKQRWRISANSNGNFFIVPHTDADANVGNGFQIDHDGQVGIGIVTPLAALHLPAGSTAAETAPLKFIAGSPMTTPEVGAVEFDGTYLYYTDMTSTRRTIASTSGADFTGAITTTDKVVSPYVYGSESAAGNLVIDSTTNASKGDVIIAPSGGDVGIGTSSPAGMLANNSIGPLDESGVGIGSMALNWTGVAAGYVAAFHNQSTGTDFNGVLAKTADTSANSIIFNAMSGTSSKFLVRADGNVGIGTTSPTANLFIYDTSTNLGQITTVKDSGGSGGWSQVVYRSSAWGPQIGGSHARGSQSAPGALLAGDYLVNLNGSGFDGTGWSQAANIYLQTSEAWTSTAHGSQIRLQTTNNGTVIPTTKMFIGNDGNVGIGTTSPENLNNWNRVLDVYAAGHSKITSSSTNVNMSINAHDTGYYGAPAGGLVGTLTNHPVSLYTNGASRMTVSATGDIGIGTASPSYKVHVTGGDMRVDKGRSLFWGDTNNYVKVEDAVLGKDNVMTFGTYGSGTINGAWRFRDVTNSIDRMIIHNNTGNVGIATTNPGAKLEVVGLNSGSTYSSGEQVLVLRNGNNSLNARGAGIRFDSGAYTSGAAQIDLINGGTANQGHLSFGTRSAGGLMSEKMRITSEGLVGITTPSPASKLHIDAALNGSPGGLFIDAKTRDGAEANIPLIQVDAGIAGGNATAFWVNTSGKVGIGTASPNSRLVVTSDPLISGGTNTAITADAPGIASTDTALLLRGKSGAGSVNNLMIVRGDGNVGIGNTTPSEKLEVSGNVLATSYLYTSDARLKKDVKKIARALLDLEKVRGVHFNWIATNQKEMGFIAQEIEKIHPELVVTNKQTGMKSVKYGNMVALLVEAIKELKAEKDLEVKNLKREVASLKELVCLDHPNAEICKKK